MKKNMLKLLVFCVALCSTIVGCVKSESSRLSEGGSTIESGSSSDYYVSWYGSEDEYKVSEGEEYKENEDGTYTLYGKNFKYKLEISKEDDESFSYIILANNTNVTYEEILNNRLSNGFNSEVEWVEVGWKRTGYKIKEDGTYVYGKVDYRYKKVVPGMREGSKITSSYTVLTNLEQITYEQIDSTSDNEGFVVIEWSRYE